MKEKFLFLLLVSVAALVFAVSCSDDEGGDVEAKINCNSNVDCNRDSYCDLDNPQQDAELGMLVYYCKKRQLCSTQADCPINWKCKENEGFCITNKEADGILCKSNDDCKDPDYPICNLANGECRSYGGETADNDNEEIPGADDYDNTDTEKDDDPEENDSDTADKDDDVSDDDADTSSEPGLGKTIMTENFEDGGSKWTIVPSSEEVTCWWISSPTSGPGEARSGANVAATNLEGNYSPNCKDLLYFNESITVPSEGKPEISFYAWVDLVGNGYSPYDYVEVLVKKSGDTWELVDDGLLLSADTPSSPLAALDNHKTKITKQLGTQYYKFTGDLSAFKGQSVNIGFRFTSDESDEASGFYLDDITVSY